MKPAAAPMPIFLFGAGGHPRVVFDVVGRQGRYEVTVVLDDAARPGQLLFGVPVTSASQGLRDLARVGPSSGIVAIGDNEARAQVARRAAAAGLGFVSAIDPSAQVGREVTVGAGTVVMPGVVVNTGAAIGEHAILNTSCSVDHDCRLAPFVHVSPGAHLGGHCTVGELSQIGIGASVIPSVRIGARVTIGAGAVVIGEIPDGTVAVGVPARPIRKEPA
jgi:sugar O-acyltransferase (sialic acid O-acetyltransferase NeuD family)